MTIIKNSMANLRDLSSGEITLLRSGDCEYIELTGYYSDLKYDRTIQYYLSSTSESDDDFSVIEVGTIKLEHNFGNAIDLIYCGVRGDGAADETELINAVLVKLKDKGIKEVTISGIYYLIPGVIPRQIKLQGETNYFLNGTIFATLSASNDNLIVIDKKKNIKFFGGKIVGNKYCFRAIDDISYKMWRANTTYALNDYVYVNRVGLIVTQAGRTGFVKPSITSTTFLDNTVEFMKFDNDLGEWGAGISITESENVHIEGVEITECWGDGIYVNELVNGRISKVDCHDNRRQGISIIDCDGLLIANSTFNRTSGTIPEAGIDLEPNSRNTVRNVNIVNCQCDGNEGMGVLITTPDELSTVRDVNIVNLTTRNNIDDGFSCRAEEDNYYHTIFNVNVDNLTSTGNHAAQIHIRGTNGVKITKGRVENNAVQPIVKLFRTRKLKISELDIVGGGNGIEIEHFSHNLSIKENYFETNGRCIVDDRNVNYRKENITIKENTLKSVTESCIELFQCLGLNINDNIIMRANKNGINLENVLRTNITMNRISNIGLLNDDTEYSHIKIEGSENNEIICDNNILSNDTNVSYLPVGVNAQISNLKYSTFRTLHSYNWSDWNSSGADKIFFHPTIQIDDIR